MAMLGTVLMLGFPVALVASVLLAAVVFSGAGLGGARNGVPVVLLLLAPVVLWITGVFLLRRMGEGFTRGTRKRVLIFHACLPGCCGVGLVALKAELPVLLIMMSVAAIPAVATLLTRPEAG
jgi:hypothetical protein